ncbi:MAG: protein kinase [Lentisphaeraceae bacterium]|nr:protein kinase [Lentisphaeraceae bacterium]
MSDAKTISDVSSPKLPWEVFPEQGDSFAAYTLGEALGKGSFGTVFKVQSDPDVEWFEAIKILHRSGDIDKKRFLEEISRLKEIRIPGMARIHAAGEYDGYLYYSMDYIEGQTIDDYVENCNQLEVFRLFFDLCDTVQRLHELEFVHLDIKPHNVMVNEEGQVRLLDLGISQKIGEGKDISSEGFGAGTYEYAPAEQIDGKVPNNGMDVYSLGCLLYTLLTSAHPKIPYDPIKRGKPYGKFYPKSNIEREELLKACLSLDNTDIRKHGILLNDNAVSAIMKSLALPDKRFKSVKEFKDSLEKSGVLLDSFIIGYEALASEIYSRISKAVNDISLEFSSQLQIFLVEKDRFDNFDLILSSNKEVGQDVLLISNSDEVNDKFVKELRRRVFDKANNIDDEEAWEESPYKSLSSYTEKEADLFFGRDNEIIDIYSQIEKISPEEGLLAVLAPSGAGKSSFLQAGVIPYFKNEHWIPYFCWPGLGGFSQVKVGIETFLDEEAGRKVIIVDQFEEYLHDSEDASAVAEVLNVWSAHKDTFVIVSLRNDFYKEYISFIEHYKLPDNFYNLPQPDEVNLAKMIKMPALKAHLTFERDPLTGKGLDEVLKDEALLNPESLAALSFTLDEIFSKSVRGRMSYSVYSELGGMHGAMAKRAESLFRSLNLRRANHAFHHVFHQLIQVDENRIPRRLHAEYDKLTSDEDSKRLTDEFIKGKLFQVTSEVGTNNRIVTVSHEALIQQNQENGWRRVMYWLNKQRNNLLIRKRLAVAVNDWVENNRQSRFLYSSYGRLKEILSLRKSGWSLGDLENNFIKQSYRAMLRNASLVFVSFVALIWISVSLWQETNTVSDLTKNINERKQEVEKLSQEANHQRKVLESLRQQEEKVKKQLSAMDNYNRLSLISSLQQSGALPPATAISLLSEVSQDDRNWLWGQLLYKSLPDYLMLFGHEEEVLSVQFSPDEQSEYLLTSSWDDSVKLWSGLSGELLMNLPWNPISGDKMDFEYATFSHDGYAVGANNDGYLYLWDIEKALNEKGFALPVKMPHVKIRKLFFSKDKKYMVCAGSEGDFSVWDWVGKKFDKPLAVGVHTDTGEEDLMRVYSAEISPDGKSIVSAGWDGKIKLWSWDGKSLNEGRVVGTHDSQIWSGTFNDDGSYYLSAGRDRVAKLWDATTFELVNEYGSSQDSGEHRSDVRSAVFSPDNRTVVTASRDKKIRFWDLKTANLIFERQIHDNIIYDISFSNDGKRFASASADQLVNLCYLENFLTDNVKPGKKLFHSEPVEHFDVLTDTMATAASDGTVRIWDLYPGTLRSYFVHELKKNEFLLKSFLLSKEQVLTADSSGSIFTWKLVGEDWQKENEINKSSDVSLYDLVLSQTKDFLAASFIDGRIKIWQLSSGELVYDKEPVEMKNPVLSFSKNSEILSVGDEEGQVVVLDWRKDSILKEWQPHSRKIFDLKVEEYEGREVIVTSSRDGSVILSDFEGDQVNMVSHGIRGDASYAAISSDSSFMVTASARDNNVFLWDLKNGIELLPLSGHEEPVSQVEFVNDDLIVSASRDGTVRLWYSLSWEQLKKTLMSNGDKTLTSQEMLQKAVRAYLYGSY